MSASWYDVLGVDAAASTDEIRAAWRSATDDLDPTDRRFDLYNEAAKVLLDADARIAYDAAQSAPTPAPEPAPEPKGTTVPPMPPALPAAPAPVVAGSPLLARVAAPLWLLIALGLSTLLIAGVAAYQSFKGPDDDRSRDAAAEASAVAEDSFGNVLTYRWDDLETAHQRATALLTSDYRSTFDKVWALVESEAVKVKAVVRTDVIRTGVVRTSDDGKRVELVAVIRNSVTNSGGDQGTGYLMLGLTMVEVDGSWLIDRVDGLDESAENETGS